MIWPISVKFGQMLEKYITNRSVSGNSIIYSNFFFLESFFRAFTPHGFLAVLKMFFVTFERNRIKENLDTFFKLLGS